MSLLEYLKQSTEQSGVPLRVMDDKTLLDIGRLLAHN